MTARVLVLGATRILRPAVVALVAGGATVIAVARTAGDLGALAADVPGVVAVAGDRADPGLAAWLVAEKPDAAIIYAPDVLDLLVTQLAGFATGPVVHVVTSSAARPAGDEPEDGESSFWTTDRLPPAPVPNVVRLVLGWTPQGEWHTPEQISAAALATLAAAADAGTDAVLGVVRPWSDRP